VPADDSRLRFSFLVAGSQKSGTSSLSALLDQHPNVQRAPRKEMHYFDDESRDWATTDHAEYSAPARGRRHRLLGDATPLYLWWPQALRRIHDYDPAMRMIVVFRDPIERLFSQWLMVLNRWPAQAPSWPGFLTRFAPDGLEDEIPTGVHVGAYRMQSGVVRGYYGAQLERGFELFGAERFHLLEFRAFLSDHTSALDEITDFLELPRFATHPALPHSMAGKPGVSETAPTSADVAGLVDRYRDDFETFRRLSGLDVAHWPTSRLLAGDLTPGDVAERLAAKVVAPGAGRPAGDPVSR
jgi:hypothetical protein